MLFRFIEPFVVDNGNKEKLVMFIKAKLYETIKSNIRKKFPDIIQ